MTLTNIFVLIEGLLCLSVVIAIIAARIIGKRKESGESEIKPSEWERIVKEREGAEIVENALKSAYFGLRKQNAGGFGVWLSACIQKSAEDYVPAKVALTALNWTIGELNTYAPGRFDLTCVYDSINAIIVGVDA